MIDNIINKLKERKQNLIDAKKGTEPHSRPYIQLNERISEIEDIIYLIIQEVGKDKYE